MLRKGATGQEILSILDAITSDVVTVENTDSITAVESSPTLDEIVF